MDEEQTTALAPILATPERRLYAALFKPGVTYQYTRFAILRLLGLVYFVAFVSAFVQLPLGEVGNARRLGPFGLVQDSVQLDRRIDLALHRINIRLEAHQRATVARNGQDQIVRLVIDDPVRIGHRRQCAQHGIGLQVEDHNCPVATAVCNEATAHSRNNRRSV